MGIQFDSHVSDLAYYSKEEGIERAEFLGNGSRLMGLPKLHDTLILQRLFDGQNPWDGSQLTLRKRAANARGMYDITVKWPKAASILRDLAGDTRIDDVARQARDLVVRMIEAQVVVRVQTDGRNEKVNSQNLVVLDVPHTMTRPVKADGEPDIHRHHHLLIPNLSYDRQAGIWKSIEFGRLDRKGIADAYHKCWQNGLTKLGYKVDLKRDGIEVRGLGSDIESLYCRRRAECEEEKKKRGEMHPKTQAKLAVITRAQKRPGVQLADMVPRWLSRLTDFQTEALKELVDKAKALVRREIGRARLRSHVANLQRQVYTEQERSAGHGLSR
jgi:conjugative relaxase-like TrwC/TraI family protein